MSATSPPSPAIVIDFSCGFQSSLSSGIRSSIFLADGASSSSCSIISSSRVIPLTPLHGSFIGGRPVDRRDRNIVQPEINRKLPAVMDYVIHDKRPHYRDLRHCEIDLLSITHGPCFHELLIDSIS